MLCLALTLWPLGDVGRAVSLVERRRGARSRGSPMSHTCIMGNACGLCSRCMRDDHCARRRRTPVETSHLIASTRSSRLWRAHGPGSRARGSAGRPSSGARGHASRRRTVARANSSGLRWALQNRFSPKREARRATLERALATLDEGLTTAQEPGKPTPTPTCTASAATSCANSIPTIRASGSGFQGRCRHREASGDAHFELRAALSLAKLYQSTGRPAEARAVLAPALEGFSPTPEMPEIAEAQALLAALDGD